jgi:4-hydroxyacetophenone monooxygenase
VRQTGSVRFDVEPEPIAASDDEIRASLVDAPIPPLLASVAHLTGDLSIARADLLPDLARVLEPDAGYSPEQIAEARELAAGALIRHRDAGNPKQPPLSAADRRRLVEFVSGAPIDDDAEPLYEAELALDGADLRRPTWTVSEISPGTRVTVGIVGAGMSGIIAAHRLRQAGIEVVVFEKNDDVGGTWLENDYPGCRVDIQNHFYSYATAQTPDWPQYHSPQPVLLDYFRSCIERFSIADCIRYSTEVLGARWDETECAWFVDTSTEGGPPETHRLDALVCATGQLNRPAMPDIKGIDDFTGPSFHSARWDWSVDLRDKRVAVIGTGASAAQFIPRVADVAADLVVFQRTPPWLLPVPGYEDDVSVAQRALLRHVPQFANWDRLWIFARTQEGLLPLATVDPKWDGDGTSVSAANEMLRTMLGMYYEVAFPDPELRAKMLPSYPPIAKRVVLDGGLFPTAIQQANVTVETTPIDAINAGGIATTDGAQHDVDVIIYGTGFQASDFLTPMKIEGTGGRDLREGWDGDARAYLGITVPHFPNLFLMYGPNTNIVINGSITYFSECEAQFIVESIGMLLRGGFGAMEPKEDVHDAYNVVIDEGNHQMAWGVSDVNTWYRNAKGRIAQNWPFDLVRYWRQTRTPEPDDYVLR